MASDCKDLPPSYEEAIGGPSEDLVNPATLVFTGTSVVFETRPLTPCYQLSWDVTSIPQKSTSVVFEEVEHSPEQPPEKAEATSPAQQQKRHLYYLAHPAGAQYQVDRPAYYATSASPDNATLGNIGLETSKTGAFPKKMEFKAMLSARKTASDSPLFDEWPQPLFDARPKWTGGYAWVDAEDNGRRQIAHEEDEKRGGRRKLVVTAPLRREVRDALVAAWCLRLWHDTAESKEAKRDGELLGDKIFARMNSANWPAWLSSSDGEAHARGLYAGVWRHEIVQENRGTRGSWGCLTFLRELRCILEASSELITENYKNCYVTVAITSYIRFSHN